MIISVFVIQEKEIGAWQIPVCPGQAFGFIGEETQALANSLTLVWTIWNSVWNSVPVKITFA